MTPNSRPFHIVMLVDDWFPQSRRKVGTYGGTQVHVRELKRYLETKHNCLVTLFYQSHPNLVIRLLWPLIAFLDVCLYSRYHRINLLHAHGLRSSIPAKLLSMVLKVPVVQTVHGSHALDRNRKTPQWYWEQLILTKIPYTSQITVTKNFLQYGNINTGIKVITNGVNLADFNRVKVNKNSQPTLIWVGKDDPAKGLSYLKRAILKVRKVIPELQTELVADGRLTGRELIKTYKRSHVFALSSVTEGQPITLLEAWAARLPVVVTAVGDNALMVKNGRNGYLVEPQNPTQLAAAIIRILKSRTRGERMGEAGYRLVKQHFSWQKMATETNKVYQQAQSLFANHRPVHASDTAAHSVTVSTDG